VKLKNPIYKIAITHLLAKKRQTIVATLGVMFGIMIFIFQAGLITGFQTTFIEQTINTTANIHIYNDPQANRPSVLDKMNSDENKWVVVNNQKPKDELNKIRNGYQIMSLIENHPDVAGVSPFLGTQAIMRSDYMTFGDIGRLKTVTNGIILGEGLAEKLGVKMNDNIVVIAPTGTPLDMKVVGINRTGLTEVDKTRAYISIRNAQKLLNVDNSYITDINIKLKDIQKAEPLSKEFEEKFGYRADDWKEANANIFGIFKIQNLITYLIIISILIVSGFGIFNILMMIIYEKLPDIAIMKATGFKDRDIRKLFQIESLIIGVIGGVLGLILGYVVTKIIGSIRMDIKGFVSMEYLHFNRSPLFYIFAFLFALISTSLAGYFPARRASRVDPIDIIRAK
jgi:lipoprotein-releasing system permease protein